MLTFFLSILFLNNLVFAKAKVINSLPTTDKKISLTFDADMTPYMASLLKKGKVKTYYDKPLIDFLQKNTIPSTIFVTGMWANIYSEELKNLSKDKLFEIANHSHTHPGFSSPCWNLASIEEKNKFKEFLASQSSIKRITGLVPKLFRFPGGCFTQSDLDLASKYGLKTIGWDISSTDAFNKNPDQIIQTVLSKVKPGSIIVFHLGSPDHNTPSTSIVISKLVPLLQKKGYEFVRVGDLIN